MEILKVQLTTDNIKNLASNAIPVLAAPGSGKAILVHEIVNTLNFNTVGFDNTNSIYVTNDPSDTNSYYCETSNMGLVETTRSIGNKQNAVGGYHIHESAPLYLVGSGDSSTGDSTADVYIIYSIIDL